MIEVISTRPECRVNNERRVGMNMRKLVALVAAVVFTVGFAAPLFARGAAEDEPYIAVVSKGEQHDFWQQVRRGAEDAATEFGVDMTYEGPASEADVQDQVQMLNTALAQNPVAIALAALDTDAVRDQLEDARGRGIPVVGFDSGVPNPPEGSIVANAATNNYAAAGMAAERMFEEIRDQIDAASSSNPVTIVVFNQDAAGESLISRGTGFRDRMVELIVNETGHGRDSIRVSGNPRYVDADSPTSGDAVYIYMAVPASSRTQDVTAGANQIFRRADDENIIGLFASNEGTVGGVLSATDDGSALASQYSGVTVVGFDAGAAQKAAVRNGYFLGSITQDPYMIGYEAVRLAYQAWQGEEVADVDTGAQFWNAANMDDDELAPLLYD